MHLDLIIAYAVKQLFFQLFIFPEISKPGPQPFRIKNVEAGASYLIWMTASTNAGESPKGNEELIYVKSNYTISSL